MPTPNPILDYLNAIVRYRLVAVCALVVGAILTVWTVRILPNVYQSTTLIMVEAQDVPQSFVKATVNTRVEERLAALSQEVQSRTRLEAIINDFGLFQEARQHGASKEEIVDAMRRKIRIQVFPQDNAFRISYEGAEPEVVQRVTARLAGLYIDENLRIREQHVSGTTEFLENELEKAKRQLEEQEKQIEVFKQKYMGELPEQRETNMRALEGLRVQLQTVSMALSSATERRAMLDRQVREMSAVRAGTTDTNSPSVLDPRARLQALEAQLRDLRSRYTSEHPDVLATQRQIERLRSDLQGEGPAASSSSSAVFVAPELARAVTEAQLEVSRLKAEVEHVTKAIEMYQGRVEHGFEREQDLQKLTRDYEVTRLRYQSMLDKKLEAQLSQSLERRQKGERFRVLDPASMPETPVRPNRQMLLLVGLVGSLGLALGLPILLWQLDTSFHVADELAACALAVLAVIPEVASSETVRRRRRYRLRVVGASAAALVVGLVGISLYGRYLF